MANNFVIKKRLLGVTDVNFDTDGTNATESFTGSNGQSLESPKVNASHVPILEALRAKLGNSVEVNTALNFIADALQGITTATDTTEGLVELATLLELQTGTDGNRVITPAVLMQLAATASQLGLAQFATLAEVAAKSADNKVLSPAHLASIGGVPTATIITWGTSTVPDGFIECNGASLDTTTYASLFAVVGYQYGGSGASFTLPDYRGEFLRGWDNGRGADPGRSIGSFQSDAIRNITGNFSRTSAVGFAESSSGLTGAFYLGSQMGERMAEEASSGYGVRFSAARVVPTANQNRPRNLAVMYCIKY